MQNSFEMIIKNPTKSCYHCAFAILEEHIDFHGDQEIKCGGATLLECKHPVSKYIYSLPDRERNWIYAMFGKPGVHCFMNDPEINTIAKVDDFIREFRKEVLNYVV